MSFIMTITHKEPHLRYKKIELDETIFIRIAENDIKAFEQLYYQTERIVYSYALSLLKNHDEAMDVLQETYLKIRGAAHLYQPIGKPMAWILTITRNLCMNKFRMDAKAEIVEEEELENQISFSSIPDQDDRILLLAALKILDLQEREIILLHAVSGFKHREIAANLELSLGTVLSKYHRGISKLKKYLKEQGVQE